MFSNKEKNTSSSPVATGTNALNSLVHGTEIEGKVNAESDIRVDGVIKGSLTCKSKVIIGPQGYIEGQIRCANAIIEGRFEGNLQVTDLLNVKKTAEINGEISTGKLIVEAGAIFNVTCHMGKGKQQKHDQPSIARKSNQKGRTLKKEAS